MEIESQALTSCEIAPDGNAISFGFVDAGGKPATIRLSLTQVGALAMTLPGLIDKALQTRFGDQSLRYAYPLASWEVEQSTDPTHGMMTLRTVGRFQRLLFDPSRAAERTRRGAGGGAGGEGDSARELARLRFGEARSIHPSSFLARCAGIESLRRSSR